MMGGAIRSTWGYLSIDSVDKKVEYLGSTYLLNEYMAGDPRISLEHWRSLLAVVDAGGYAQAAAVLHKSQSAVTYAVQKMESLLGVKIFEVIGRKAHLTSTGVVLYRRAKALLDEASALEVAAGTLAAGWEAELRLSVESIFATWLLLQSFAPFPQHHPHTRLPFY